MGSLGGRPPASGDRCRAEVGRAEQLRDRHGHGERAGRRCTRRSGSSSGARPARRGRRDGGAEHERLHAVDDAPFAQPLDPCPIGQLFGDQRGAEGRDVVGDLGEHDEPDRARGVVHHRAQRRRPITPPRRIVDHGQRQVVGSRPDLAAVLGGRRPGVDLVEGDEHLGDARRAIVRQPFDPLPDRRPIGIGEDDHVEVGGAVLDARLDEQSANGCPRELIRAHERHPALVCEIDRDRHHR